MWAGGGRYNTYSMCWHDMHALCLLFLCPASRLPGADIGGFFGNPEPELLVRACSCSSVLEMVPWYHCI